MYRVKGAGMESRPIGGQRGKRQKGKKRKLMERHSLNYVIMTGQ